VSRPSPWVGTSSLDGSKYCQHDLHRERRPECIAAAQGRGACHGRKPLIDAAEMRWRRTEERSAATLIRAGSASAGHRSAAGAPG